MEVALLRLAFSLGILGIAILNAQESAGNPSNPAGRYRSANRPPNTPFNVGEVIERVSHHPVSEGGRIIIRDRTYEAFFDTSGIVLRARKPKEHARDLVIPLSGKPVVKDGRVAYCTSSGEILFEGCSQGLKYEEIGRPSTFTSPMNEYSGNVARLKEGSGDVGEFLIDTTIIYTQAPSNQDKPAIAFGELHYLVVWVDWSGNTQRIRGARVSKSGSLVDPAGITLPKCSAHREVEPSIVFDGINYFVVWVYSNVIYGARVSQDGVLLDTAGTRISFRGDYSLNPAVAFDGSNYLVVWQSSEAGLNIYGARVARTGILIDSVGFVITGEPGEQEFPSVAFDGVNYLVAWHDTRNYDIFGARVSKSGVVLDSTCIAVSSAASWQTFPEVSFDGGNYLVVWQDSRGGDNDIFCARVTEGGLVLDTSGVCVSRASNNQLSPSVAFDGTNYLVAWRDCRNDHNGIFGARVSREAVLLDSGGIEISRTDSYDPAAAFDGVDYFVGWVESPFGVDTDIYGARITTGGNVLDTVGAYLSGAANRQSWPSVASDGSDYLVVWDDLRSYPYADIYGARVTHTGTILDPGGIAISRGTDDQIDPSVVFAGGNYFAVWQDHRAGTWDILGARIDQQGIVLDSIGILISDAPGDQVYASAAFCDSTYFIVWADSRVGSDWSDIYGARVTQTGMCLDPIGIKISPTYRSNYHPSLVSDGADYLVVWDYAKPPPFPWRTIYGVRVSSSGVILDTTAIVVSQSHMYATNFPSVSFDGTYYLCVWEDARSSTSYDIYGARVSRGGSLLDSANISICTLPGHQRRPAVAFDNTDHVVVWEDYRTGLSWDIFGAKVNPTGTVVDSFLISAQPENQVTSAVACGLGGQILVTYSGWIDSIDRRSAGTMRIWGKFPPPVAIGDRCSQKLAVGSRLQISPNPFVKSTTLKLHVPGDREAEVEIYDVTGRSVKRFKYRAVQLFGAITWHGDDAAGHSLPAGVYFCRLKSGTSTTTKKLVKLQ